MCVLSSSACLHTVSAVCGHVVLKCLSEIRPSFWGDGIRLEDEGSENTSFLHLFSSSLIFSLSSPQQFSHLCHWAICSGDSELQRVPVAVFSLRATPQLSIARQQLCLVEARERERGETSRVKPQRGKTSASPTDSSSMVCGSQRMSKNPNPDICSATRSTRTVNKSVLEIYITLR